MVGQRLLKDMFLKLSRGQTLQFGEVAPPSKPHQGLFFPVFGDAEYLGHWLLSDNPVRYSQRQHLRVTLPLGPKAGRNSTQCPFTGDCA
jgi:hypothetical protein